MDNLLSIIRQNSLFEPRARITPFNPKSPDILINPGIGGGNDDISPIGRMNDSFTPQDSPLFSGGMARPEADISPRSAPSRDQDIIDMMTRLYSPENKYSDMYEKELANQPKREKAGLGRKIAASALGFFSGSPTVADRFTHPKYYAAMPDWKERMQRLEPLMREERATNQGNRAIASSTASTIMQDRRLAESERKAKEAEADKDADRIIREKDAESRRIRATAYDYQVRNPNSHFEKDSQGNLIAIDPKTKVAEYVVDPQTGKAINTGDLGDAQKLGIQLANAKTLEGLRQSNRVSLEETKQGNRAELEATRQANREKLIHERASVRQAAHGTDKAMSVSQEAAAWKLARQQYITDNPTHAIFWGKDGLPTDDAADDDTGTYERAVEDIRNRFNRIKSTKPGNNAVVPPKPNESVKPTEPNKDTTPPPMEQRKKGMRFTWPNGNVGEWDGTKWVPIVVKVK